MRMDLQESGRSFWRGRRVFVTGAAGLLGSWLTKDLVANGAEVSVLIRPSHQVQDPSARVFRCSVTERAEVARAMASSRPELVFHLAAQPIVGQAEIDPVETLETNVQGTWNVLDACRMEGVNAMVVASSGKVYGEGGNRRFIENDPLDGAHPYGTSKSCAETIASMYARTYGLTVAMVRCGNLFGAGDLNFSRTIPAAIRAALLGEQFVMRSDGSAYRDFLFVRDAVDGYVKLGSLLLLRPELAGEAFNFGTGHPMTVRAMVERVFHRAGTQPVIVTGREAEPQHQLIDSSKACRVLGWSAKSTIDEALGETIAWYRNHLSGVEMQRGAG